MSEPPPALVFVYNADQGVFNALSDSVHKILSPRTYACRLCAITHGAFGERDAWRRFVESLDRAVRFLHRDEFVRSHDQPELSLPAVLLEHADGRLEPWIDAEAINACTSIDDLTRLITRRLA